MCVNKALSEASYPTGTPSIAKIEPYSTGSSDNSRTSCDDNDIIAFGPIKVKPRKKPAPTLATGRRSKYEVLSPEEEQKRNVRRARNRAAAERVRISRLSVEQQLLNEIMALEEQTSKLSHDVHTLQHQKLHLETRLFTHERMCPTVVSSHLSLTSDIDLTTYFPSNVQQFEATLSDKMADADFESFFDSLTNEQIQQNFPESISSLIHIDDLNDLLMD